METMKMKNNIYVLDTNVLLADFMALYAFGDNDVVIPSVVLQELDDKKTRMDSVGFNARAFSREIDKLREVGKLHEGVSLDNGGTISVVKHPSDSEAYDSFLDDSNDTKIVATAKKLQEMYPSQKVTMVSRDALVRIKADVIDVHAEDYLHDKVISSEDEKYKGYRIEEVDPQLINEFYGRKEVKVNKEYIQNECVLLKSGRQSALTIHKDGYLVPLYNYNEYENVFGLTARNVEQKFALELLLDESIPLVTLSGKAGTGKTLLALATALQKTVEENRYSKVAVGRPIVEMGKGIGYLKGDFAEKMRPWVQPIYDSLEHLFNCHKNETDIEKIIIGMEDKLKVEGLMYIRGRSIPFQYLIIDEAQNLTQHEVKTILTRIGENAKVVLIGDPQQIDSPYLDEFSNGLTYAIEKLKHLKETAHVTLSKGERSTLAELCADLL